MRIVILRSAIEDLTRGRDFYDRQGEGLGDYFEESLTSDIESLHLYAGIHVMAHGYHRMLSGRFPYAIYYEVAGEQIAYEPFSTVAAIQSGFVHGYGRHMPTTVLNATVESRAKGGFQPQFMPDVGGQKPRACIPPDNGIYFKVKEIKHANRHSTGTDEHYREVAGHRRHLV